MSKMKEVKLKTVFETRNVTLPERIKRKLKLCKKAMAK